MVKLLLPIDGTSNSLKATQHVVNRFLENRDTEVHLLHVRQPLSQHIARFVSPQNRASYHQEAAEEALKPARELLNRYEIPHTDHVERGQRAETIVRVAKQLNASQIVMGTARKNSLTRLLQDSVTHRVIDTAPVPVEIVPGEAVSKLERFGIPATVAALLGLLLLAED